MSGVHWLNLAWSTLCLLAIYGMGGKEVAAVRLKIQLHPEFPSQYGRRLLASNGSCSDVMAVKPSNITLYGNLKDLGPNVKFWRSESAKNNLAVFEDMKVPGLNGKTVGDIFEELRKGNCYPYFLGGSVRDQFLNRVPNDADVEVDCSMAAFGKLCLEKWGKEVCKYTPGKPVAHIGNTSLSEADKDLEVMDIGSTNSTFYVPIHKLEYTVNDMAYDTNGNDVIIDLTGTGPRDACDKHIRIPSRDNSGDSWKLWLNSTEGVLYRFWKLRSKGLVAFNKETQQFIVESAKREIEKSPESFESFYCHYVFNSKFDTTKHKCDVPMEQCKAGLANAVIYNKVFAEDLGDFWTDVVVKKYMPNLEDCKTKFFYLSMNHALL